MSKETKLSHHEKVGLIFRAYIDCNVMRYGGAINSSPSVDNLVILLEEIDEFICKRTYLNSGVSDD
jgi:hypothetical protein